MSSKQGKKGIISKIEIDTPPGGGGGGEAVKTDEQREPRKTKETIIEASLGGKYSPCFDVFPSGHVY